MERDDGIDAILGYKILHREYRDGERVKDRGFEGFVNRPEKLGELVKMKVGKA